MMGGKARILYITPAGERGGAENLLLNIIRHLDRRRIEPIVICLQNGSFVEELKAKANVDVEVIDSGRLSNVWKAREVVKQLRKIIRDRHIRLVHCNNTGAHLYGSLAAWLCGVPSIYHLHDGGEWSWTRQGVVHVIARLVPAKAAIAVSHDVARRFARHWHGCRDVHVIHNAVGSDWLQYGGEWKYVRKEYGWPAECPLVVWCGRLQQWKGPHVFVQATALVRQQIPNARFLIVGGALFGLDAPYEGALHALAKKLDLEESLRFTGHQPDVRRFMAAADVVVHSSINPEPFGLVILEAMALGKPVVASSMGGPVEIVEPGVTGILVPPGNPEELAEAIIHLLRDTDLRDKMGEAGRARAARHFSVSQMMEKIDSLYSNLCKCL